MKFIDELFEAQVARTPDAIAIEFEGHSLTYRDLNRRADDLARHLRALDVRPDVLVALFLERSFDMVVGMLGVLKAGGAYVPLDPSHPQNRLAYMLADAQPLVLLTQPHLQSGLPHHAGHLVVMDEVQPQAPQPETANTLARDPNHRDLAYVIYTSGSTGAPKGVEVEHRSVVNMLLSMQMRPGVGAGDTMLALTTLVFDIAVLEIFLPLILGARIIIASSQTSRDGAALIDLIGRSGVSVMQATPATLRMLLDAGWAGVPHLKVLCGGEAWTDKLASQLLPRCNSLWNMYGPTETTVWSAVSKVEAGKPIVVGTPIAGTRLYVLDGARQLVPVGVPGELYIGGDGLARGYFNRPELTRERFLVDPFAAAPDARMYRTGDLVRLRPDGTLDFLGRLDHQVKIRGFRIELGEIEARLNSYPGVDKAVVGVSEDQPGEKRLVAYFVGVPNITTGALRAHLAAGLPDYMVPGAYMRLDVLPLTPNGKLDRRALPVPHSSEQACDPVSLEPRTPAEQAVAKIWCEMLDLGQVGLRDNFFALGGDSLLAVHVIGKINKTLNGLLTIPAFYQDPTIEGLAKLFEQTLGGARKAQLLSLQSGQTGLPLYLIGAGPHEIRLARHIGENRPIFAIDAPIPLDWQPTVAAADRAPMPTIEDLGALYGEVLCAGAEASPCVIGGYSFAGTIAFEAARLLQNAKGNVAFVLLIDSPAYVGERHTGIVVKRSLQWIWQSAAKSTTNEAPYLERVGAMLRHYVRLLRWLGAQMPALTKNLIDKIRHRGSSVTNPSGYCDKNGVPIDQTVMSQLHEGAGGCWKPRPLDVAGKLIRVRFPGEEILPGFDSTKGWKNLFLQGLEVIQAAGDHMTMVRDENIAALSRQIRAVLDQDHVVKNLTVLCPVSNVDSGFTAAQPSAVCSLGNLS